MATSTARRRVVERLERLGGAALDDESVRREALAILATVLPFDAWSWAISDPASGLATSVLAEHPFERGMLELLRAEEDPQEVNRRSMLARAGPSVAALGSTTRGHLARSRRWREQLAEQAVADELRIVFADRAGCWGYLDLYTLGRTRYGEDEIRVARSAARLLTPPLRRAAYPPGAGARAADVREPGVLVVGNDLRVRAQTGAAASWLPQLRHGTAQPVPCAVLAVTARALAAPTDDAAVVRHRCADGQWATVRAAALDTGGVAVTIEHSAPREVLDYLARAAALTRRERDVLALLFRGNDTQAVADRLVIAPGTVHDHVKSILAKTGHASRRELLGSVVLPGRTLETQIRPGA
jgi:DNA-binding CsgD family transcriptional regulator